MRNVIYAINMTLDGCYDHTKFGGSEEMLEYYTDLLRGVDQIVYGRKIYELMIPYWPEAATDPTSVKEEIDFATVFTAIPKVVFSKTLDSVDGNARIVREDVAGEIMKLKQQSGKKISVGGVNLPSQLIALGLVDEFYFVVHPVIVGEGRRLLEDTGLQENLNLKLIDTKVFNSGCVALHYVKR